MKTPGKAPVSEFERRLEAKKRVQETQTVSMRFARLATKTATLVGSPWAFLLALASVVLWGILGPLYHYSDTWQLVINTATTVVTFLIVFLIQNTQNRDAKAIHLKLDEVIRSIRKAHNEMIDIEKLSDEELEELAKHYERIRKECDERRSRRKQPA
jgi:low affinity Fe/Cu permease